MEASNTTLHLPISPPLPLNPAVSLTNAAAAIEMEDPHFQLPPPARFSTYLAVCVILLLVAILTVGLKFTLTWKARGWFGKDDAMIALGLVSPLNLMTTQWVLMRES